MGSKRRRKGPRKKAPAARATRRYLVEIDRVADRDLRRIPAEEMDAIERGMLRLETNPRPPGVEFLDRVKGVGGIYRVRVGNFRIVYLVVDSPEFRVQVLVVSDRKDVYQVALRRIR